MTEPAPPGGSYDSGDRPRRPIMCCSIGVDAYPAGFNSLAGSVNDIDAVEGVLFDPPGSGIPPAQIRLTRLAAPGAGAATVSRFAAQTRLPTHDNIRDALLALAGPDVQPGDRVLIYYSGHGDQKQIAGSLVWHEALVPCDVQYLYDFEVNALLHAISARTSDLTVILDSCHSGGATREDVDAATLEAEGTPRFLASGTNPGTPPDPTLAHLAPAGETTASLVQSLDPPYLALVACHPTRRRGRKAFDIGRHGVLTYNLVAGTEHDPGGGARHPALGRPMDGAARPGDDRQPNAAPLADRAGRAAGFGGPWDRQIPAMRCAGPPMAAINRGGAADGPDRGGAGRSLWPHAVRVPDAEQPGGPGGAIGRASGDGGRSLRTYGAAEWPGCRSVARRCTGTADRARQQRPAARAARLA